MKMKLKVVNIIISLNNEIDKKIIKMNNKRIIYTNKILNITIIEIDEIKDDIHIYIELNNEIINSMKKKEEITYYFKKIYNNKSIYILNFLNGKDIVVSYGLISKIIIKQIFAFYNTLVVNPLILDEYLFLLSFHFPLPIFDHIFQ